MQYFEQGPIPAMEEDMPLQVSARRQISLGYHLQYHSRYNPGPTILDILHVHLFQIHSSSFLLNILQIHLFQIYSRFTSSPVHLFQKYSSPSLLDILQFHLFQKFNRSISFEYTPGSSLPDILQVHLFKYTPGSSLLDIL